MSADYFIKLRGKYNNFSETVSNEQILPAVIPGAIQGPLNIQPPRITIPESQRVTQRICPTKANGRTIVPVLIQPVPASTTTARLVSLTLQAAVAPTNPEARFSYILPPIVPPPWYLQTPPTRVSNEPYARIYPCVPGRGKVMELY